MDSVDVGLGRERERQLGRRIRDERLARGITQERMAEALGISFQQLQRYEHGTTTMSATRLQDVAALLGSSASDLLGPQPNPSTDGVGFSAATRNMSELIRLWPAVPADLRKSLLALARAVANAERG